jgi:uncharacterized integral membrane protein
MARDPAASGRPGQGGEAMASPYKRRRPSILRNFWVYRRLVLVALVLGLLLWFIWANNEKVTVAFPFRLGTLQSTTGMIILLSALVGSVATALTMTVAFAWHRVRSGSTRADDMETNPLPDDRPPADYAAKASEETRDADWS